MSRGLNKVMLIGRTGQDPETKVSASGMAICKISIATSSSKKLPDATWGEETEWHRVIMFERLAEIAKQYLRKGSQVYIEGRLRTNKWQDSDGKDRYTTEVVANEMQMLGGRGDSESAEPAQAGGVTKDQVTRLKTMISTFLQHHTWLNQAQKTAFNAEFNAQCGVKSANDLGLDDYRLITDADNFAMRCNQVLAVIAPQQGVQTPHDAAKANGYSPAPVADFDDDIPF